MDRNKILAIIIAILSIVGIVLFTMVMVAGDENPEKLSGAVSTIVTYSQFLLGIAFLAVIVGSLYSLFMNPGALKKTLLSVLVLAILFAISYFLSSNGKVVSADGVVLALQGSGTSKWVGTGITYSVILGGIAGIFFIWDLLKGIIKS